MILSIALALMTASADSGTRPRAHHAQFDARRLQTGEFVYRDSSKDKVTGFALDRHSSEPRTELPVNASIDSNTVDQRYIVYATENLPRFMVREDFPDGTISELVKRQ